MWVHEQVQQDSWLQSAIAVLDDVVELKPSLFGIGINFKALLRRVLRKGSV
jgi:hypothetical protein